jgi:hypothetical protein
MTFLNPGAPGFYNSYFLGDLVWNSGIIEFDNSTPGAFTTADIVGGNLVLGSGASVFMNVDGTPGGGNDAFQVDGSASISSALLNITTENASPPSGQQYHIISPGLGFSGTGWGAPPTNSGYPADYVFGDPGTLITL